MSRACELDFNTCFVWGEVNEGAFSPVIFLPGFLDCGHVGSFRFSAFSRKVAMLSTVVAVSFPSFCRYGIPLCPLALLSSVPFSATEVHKDRGVVVAPWGVGGVKLVVGLLAVGAWAIVVVPPVLLEGSAIIPLVLRHCFKQFLGFDTFYRPFEYCGVGANKWGRKDVLCYAVRESFEILLYAGWRSYVVAGFSAEIFKVHRVLVNFWPLHLQVLQLVSRSLIFLRVRE